jgi:hypothetical protein
LHGGCVKQARGHTGGTHSTWRNPRCAHTAHTLRAHCAHSGSRRQRGTQRQHSSAHAPYRRHSSSANGSTEMARSTWRHHVETISARPVAALCVGARGRHVCMCVRVRHEVSGVCVSRGRHVCMCVRVRREVSGVCVRCRVSGGRCQVAGVRCRVCACECGVPWVCAAPKHGDVGQLQAGRRGSVTCPALPPRRRLPTSHSHAMLHSTMKAVKMRNLPASGCRPTSQ